MQLVKFSQRLFVLLGLALIVCIPVAAQPGMGQQKSAGQVPGLTQNPLTGQQEQRIAQIRRGTQQEVYRIKTDSRLTQQQKADRIDEVRRKGHGQVTAVLTPAQQEEFQNWWSSRSGIEPSMGAGEGRGPGVNRNPTTPGTGQSTEMFPMLRNHPLTAEQKQRIEVIRTDTLRQAEALDTNASLTPEQKVQRIEELHESYYDRVANVLTSDQVDELLDWARNQSCPTNQNDDSLKSI